MQEEYSKIREEEKQESELMKILSFNMRGAGSRAKRKEVRDMNRWLNTDICCIQESKMENVKEGVCKALWGRRGIMRWTFRASEGRSGGIITMWNEEIFRMSSCWDAPGMLVINGHWVDPNFSCSIINVYSPCYLADKIR